MIHLTWTWWFLGWGMQKDQIGQPWNLGWCKDDLWMRVFWRLWVRKQKGSDRH